MKEPNSSNQSNPGYETQTAKPSKTKEVYSDNDNGAAGLLTSSVLVTFLAVTIDVLL